MRRAAKRDENEAYIRLALERHGAKTWPISGEGLPDLLVLFRGRYYAMEVKGKHGKRTPAQEASQHPVVRTPAEALRIIGAA